MCFTLCKLSSAQTFIRPLKSDERRSENLNILAEGQKAKCRAAGEGQVQCILDSLRAKPQRLSKPRVKARVGFAMSDTTLRVFGVIAHPSSEKGE